MLPFFFFKFSLCQSHKLSPHDDKSSALTLGDAETFSPGHGYKVAQVMASLLHTGFSFTECLNSQDFGGILFLLLVLLLLSVDMDLELVSLEIPCPLDVDPAAQAGSGFQNRQRACNKYSSLTSATAKNKGGKKKKRTVEVKNISKAGVFQLSFYTVIIKILISQNLLYTSFLTKQCRCWRPAVIWSLMP